MLYRLALTSSLIIASTLAIEQAVVAQSVDVPFNGTVPLQATFSTPISGSAESTISITSGSPTKFESQTPAILSVQTSTPATITVSPPRLVSGSSPDPSGTKYVGFLKFGSTSVSSDVGGGSTVLPQGNNSLEIGMLVERPEAFAPGTYTYIVTLTVTP
ncbi:hypothetical protein WDZ92_23265 [Nostoc sp. NIES-2111]